MVDIKQIYQVQFSRKIFSRPGLALYIYRRIVQEIPVIQQQVSTMEKHFVTPLVRRQ